MKIVVAPNAFKDSLSAGEVVRAIGAGIRAADPDIEIDGVAVADGGDGLFEVFQAHAGGEVVAVPVSGPRFAPVEACYLYCPPARKAVIEMARASGLALLPREERDARAATTLGVGQLVLDAVRRGARHIVVGIGGSATNDGGMGFASALGCRFTDASGRELAPVGESLPAVVGIDVSRLPAELSGVVFEAVCDVDNPLTGPHGAAAVYGPQKGATAEDVAFLDAGLANLAERVKRVLGRDYAASPGAGAAGGLGFGLASFVGAALRPGVEIILDMVELDRRLRNAALAITAEGRIDFQTAFGKAPAGVASRAKKMGVPCVGLAGSVAGDVSNLHELGMDAVFSLCPGPMRLEDAMRDGAALLTAVAEQAVRAFLAGRRHA